MALTYLERLLKANAHDVNVAPEFAIEVVAVPRNQGGGFHVCIPALGRWFALADGDTIAEAIKSLDTFLREGGVIRDKEHRQAYKEKGITIP